MNFVSDWEKSQSFGISETKKYLQTEYKRFFVVVNSHIYIYIQNPAIYGKKSEVFYIPLSESFQIGSN